MKNIVFYLISVGVAYYSGMKLTEQKVKVKTKIVYRESMSYRTSFILTKKQLDECIDQYNVLVDEANQKINDLEDEIDLCEDKYYVDTTKNTETYPKKNLEPENVGEKDPEMDEYFEE